MIPASDNWKALKNLTILPEAFIKITLSTTDPDIQPSLTSTSTNEEYYSDTNSLVNELDKNCIYYTTLEDSCFMLDGTENFISQDSVFSTTVYGSTGYVSDSICDDKTVFQNKPIITVKASKVHANVIQGMTLTWSKAYNEYPTDYTIKVWENNTLLTTKVITNNKDIKNVVMFDFSNFNKITIEIDKWCLPNKRARMEEIFVGVDHSYDKNEIMSFTHTSTCDILSGKLPKNEIEFKLDNSKLQWDFNNLHGANKYLLERQEITVHYGYKINNKIEWIRTGTYYMCSWETPSNGIQVTFKARDLLDFMSDQYTGPTVGTLYDICVSALEQAHLPLNRDGTKKYYVDKSLKSYNTDFTPKQSSNKKGYTIAQILQLCSNAGMCVMYQDYLGIIRIEPQYIKLENYVIDEFVSYSYPELVATKILKDININNGLGRYTVGEKGETQTLTNNMIITKQHAEEVAKWVADSLKFRYTVKGKYRSDPRLEVTDLISVQSRFNTYYSVAITKVKETYNGAFRSEYEGRMQEFKPINTGYSGIYICGENLVC